MSVCAIWKKLFPQLSLFPTLPFDTPASLGVIQEGSLCYSTAFSLIFSYFFQGLSPLPFCPAPWCVYSHTRMRVRMCARVQVEGSLSEGSGDPASYSSVQRLELGGHRSDVRTCALSADGTLLATASNSQLKVRGRGARTQVCVCAVCVCARVHGVYDTCKCACVHVYDAWITCVICEPICMYVILCM